MKLNNKSGYKIRRRYIQLPEEDAKTRAEEIRRILAKALLRNHSLKKEDALTKKNYTEVKIKRSKKYLDEI